MMFSLGLGRDRFVNDLTLTRNLQFKRAIGASSDFQREFFPSKVSLVANGHDAITSLNPSFLGGRIAFNDPNHYRFAEPGWRFKLMIKNGCQEDNCQQNIHDRTHHSHEKPLPFWPRQEFLNPPSKIFGRIFSGHFDVAAQRNGTNPVVRLAFAKSKKPRSKTHGESFHSYPEKLGHKKMAQLMDDHDCTKHQHHT